MQLFTGILCAVLLACIVMAVAGTILHRTRFESDVNGGVMRDVGTITEDEL